MAVVVGVDASEAGRRAVRFATRLRDVGDGRVVVAHVVPWSPFTVQSAEENERRSLTKAHEVEMAHRLVDPLVEQLRGEGVRAEAVVRHGHPAETLCALAREAGATHLVVGRTGESRVRSLLFGSTASNLIQIAEVPVTVVP
ncbi:universal stress protein [Vallicoccus soli]|uniref:Universal stress protein n=1 Tax=Vallicoccus soli TaxID=2339232 RepID=A0A3A3ZG64_9ACTN|nr:universal stress protein [Vallicoccus soli]RJK94186.1 universal stress protein [Vallicoccus soli]